MVKVLSIEGNLKAAIVLENLWTDLGIMEGDFSWRTFDYRNHREFVVSHSSRDGWSLAWSADFNVECRY